MAKPLFMSQQEFAKHLKDSLIRRFKECMRRQFSEIVKTRGGLTDKELRDVVRTFAMGWAECYAASGDTLRTHAWALALGEITLDHWYPGPEWRFWE